ncbi:hypothetical protein SAMN05428944_5520 [Streptomyces sp. 1222.5]|nr:hypothetical protein BX260_2576 [Streptomyces sp. 5112.2]SEC89514.1 hypothetical protein SAMN05428944_5520 [Streptomyces sp. 1222.5]
MPRISSARQVDTALGVIDAPGTPQAVREQLTGAVREVISLLDAANRPVSQPEERHTMARFAYRTSPALGTIADSGTPREVREAVARIVRRVREQANAGGARNTDAAKAMTASLHAGDGGPAPWRAGPAHRSAARLPGVDRQCRVRAQSGGELARGVHGNRRVVLDVAVRARGQ